MSNDDPKIMTTTKQPESRYYAAVKNPLDRKYDIFEAEDVTDADGKTTTTYYGQPETLATKWEAVARLHDLEKNILLKNTPSKSSRTQTSKLKR